MEANYGGPVWHASAAWHDLGRTVPLAELGAAMILRLVMAARYALQGVGDATLGEWQDNGRAAYHLRRRVTAVEWGLQPWGMDYRGTAESRRRLAPVRRWLPAGWHE